MSANLNETLRQESNAFSSQIEERIKNGHIPDLRFSTPCDYFYNNSWRRPEYVELDFGEIFTIIKNAITENIGKLGRNIQILEVGCGPGYISLELCRHGFDVVGIDVSEKCISYAEHFSNSDPLKNKRGDTKLDYICGDFFSDSRLQNDSFDVILFVSSLHHFSNQDQVLKRAKSLLRPSGLLIAHEPVRDMVTKGNASFNHLLRVLLSLGNGFYKRTNAVTDPNILTSEIESLFNEMRYELDDGNKLQSVNDNEAGYKEMLPALNSNFSEILFNWRYAFFHEIIGGLRFDDEVNFQLAKYLRDMDKLLCELKVLQPTEFFYVGKKLNGF